MAIPVTFRHIVRVSHPLQHRLDPDDLLHAYSRGIFPMADGADSAEVFWVEPRRRGILPLNAFHLAKSLAKTLKSERFTLTADRAFDAVLGACAEAVPGRRETWINSSIADAYRQLHRNGDAHSVEAWGPDGALAGGLYGVRIGGAFFGESMFTRQRDASKCALAALVARLRVGGFALLDTQFLTGHLASFGARDISARAYRLQLDGALAVSADFLAFDRAGSVAAPEATDFAAMTVSGPVSGKRIAQLLTQTS